MDGGRRTSKRRDGVPAPPQNALGRVNRPGKGPQGQETPAAPAFSLLPNRPVRLGPPVARFPSPAQLTTPQLCDGWPAFVGQARPLREPFVQPDGGLLARAILAPSAGPRHALGFHGSSLPQEQQQVLEVPEDLFTTNSDKREEVRRPA